MPKRKKPKGKVNKFEKVVSEWDKLIPLRTCLVCSRQGRELQMVRPGVHRCHECKPGSPNWLDWYESLPVGHRERTNIGDNIYKYGRKL